MAIFTFEGKVPKIDASAYVHPEATIIGGVTIGANCYVGAGARIRADWGEIVIKEGANVQENAVIHAAPGVTALVGVASHVAHGAIIHGAIIGDHVMIGMGAILDEGVEIGSGSFVGAGAVVVAGTKVAPGKLVLGVPARVVGDATSELSQRQKEGAVLYQQLCERMKQGLKEA